MTTKDLATRIETALLASTYVVKVLETRAFSDDGDSGDGPVVALRIAFTNVGDVAALPQVLAQTRQVVREVVGEGADVFIEPDLTLGERHDVSTDAIVIRSLD